MGFKQFDSAKLRLNDSIRVNAHGMPIGRDAYEKLGKPTKLLVFYDTEEKAIKLEASETEGYTVSTHPAPHISIKLCKVMPIGHYIARGSFFVLREAI